MDGLVLTHETKESEINGANHLTNYSQERDCIVFSGTNVPVVYLWDAIMADETVNSFISRFSTVSKKQALDVVRIGAKATDGF